jgi:hypothetical protein
MNDHDDSASERGYRGDTPRDTPPGSVPGGSYGGGGGYRQGGYERGNFDPAAERQRSARGRPQAESDRGWGRARGDASRGRQADDPEPRGDWRQGWGAYGMPDVPAGEGTYPREGRFEQRPEHDPGEAGYGFGRAADEEGGWGLPSAEHGRPRESGAEGRRRREHGGRVDYEQTGSPPWPYLEPWAVPGPFTGHGPKGWERPPESIRNDVCERLTRHGRLDASRIRVLVERGEVILEGRVDSRQAKRMAEDTAESVTGVRDVQNRLRIDYDAGG